MACVLPGRVVFVVIACSCDRACTCTPRRRPPPHTHTSRRTAQPATEQLSPTPTRSTLSHQDTECGRQHTHTKAIGVWEVGRAYNRRSRMDEECVVGRGDGAVEALREMTMHEEPAMRLSRDAVMDILPTPGNSVPREPLDDSCPAAEDPGAPSTQTHNQPLIANSTPPSSPPQPQSSQPRLDPLSVQPTQSNLPAPPNTLLPSPTPTNPFYLPHRPSTPPIPSSSSESSPLVSPAKRFSSGQVKSPPPPPPFLPTSPRQPLSDEDRVKFTQLASQLRTRLTYAAIKVENGWEKHSFNQIKSLLSEGHTGGGTTTSTAGYPSGTLSPTMMGSPALHPPGGRRRSHTVNENNSGSKLTYESFWATHSRPHNPSYSQPPTSYQPQISQPSAHPVYHSQPPQGGHRGDHSGRYATFPRRKPERLSLAVGGAAHTARDQSAAEIMIALASPRTRSEFSSPERDGEDGNGGIVSPSPKSRRRDVDGLGINA